MIALALLGFVGALAVVAVALLRQFDKIFAAAHSQGVLGIEMARKRDERRNV